MKKILVTGGAGYIGSHTCIELAENNFEYVILDNLLNSKVEAVNRVKSISGKDVTMVKADICDKPALRALFNEMEFASVIHFAGLKAVGESCDQPIRYYQNNIAGTLNLLEVMSEQKVKSIIFSSSATVYGDPASTPITEDFPTSTTNPYGYSKLVIENMIRDLCASDKEWRATMLRYFNPVGAHDSGLIGEDPNGIPNNLLPYITQVAVGKLPELRVFGNDYPTIDGTGVRDYIHVVDLAKGHIKALENILDSPKNNFQVFNLGTGKGYSVLQIVEAFEKASGQKIPYNICGRRAGDIAECFANPKMAKELLGWSTDFGLDKMMTDSWRWQSKNPNGYE